MKVKVKTLNGTHFEIEVKPEDTVADVKKNIEAVRGPDVYPAPRQMLFHQGKVLKDDTTMEENQVSDNSTIVVMLSMPTNTRPTPPPAPAAAPPPPHDHPSSSATNPPYNQTPTRHVDGVTPPGLVLRFSKLSLHVPPLAGAAPPPAVNPRPQATQPPPASPTTPNANPLHLFPHDLPARDTILIESLRNNQGFLGFRAQVRANPRILARTFELLWNHSHRMARLILQNRAEVIRLIFEPVEGEVDEFGQPAFIVTNEDIDALERLQAMGFNILLVWQTYFAFGRNEELAANFLRDNEELAANFLRDHLRGFEE